MDEQEMVQKGLDAPEPKKEEPKDVDWKAIAKTLEDKLVTVTEALTHTLEDLDEANQKNSLLEERIQNQGKVIARDRDKTHKLEDEKAAFDRAKEKLIEEHREQVYKLNVEIEGLKGQVEKLKAAVEGVIPDGQTGN